MLSSGTHGSSYLRLLAAFIITAPLQQTHTDAPINLTLPKYQVTWSSKIISGNSGKVMVGADLSGIELRMLVTIGPLRRRTVRRHPPNGDIHQVNADKIGLKLVKTVTYALYGARKLALPMTHLNSSAAKSSKEIREAFVAAIDGLDSLLDAIKHSSERGYVRLDGRSIAVDSSHKALNYLRRALE